MNSREARAASSRRAFGPLRAGLPASVTSARICPGPGVSISSARQANGSSPLNSGSPRTLLRYLPEVPVCRKMAASPTKSAAGVVNMAPPTRSRLPVITLRTVMSQQHRAPKGWVQTPRRP